MSWKYMQRNEDGKIRTTNDGGGGGSSTLSGLTDVDISNPQLGHTLIYDETEQKWKNAYGGGGGGSLESLSDVDINTSGLQDGQILKYDYNMEKWRNVPHDVYNYSNSLKRVGNWFNARPIYAITMQTSLSFTDETWTSIQIPLTAFNILDLIGPGEILDNSSTCRRSFICDLGWIESYNMKFIALRTHCGENITSSYITIRFTRTID